MPNHPASRFAVFSTMAAMAALLAACATDPQTNKEHLDIKDTGLPTAFHVGDTSGLWTASRTTLTATGREETQNDYPSFHLKSSDSTVVAIAKQRFVVGIKEGTAQVTARDDKSTLVSEAAVTVTVVAKP